MTRYWTDAAVSLWILRGQQVVWSTKMTTGRYQPTEVNNLGGGRGMCSMGYLGQPLHPLDSQTYNSVYQARGRVVVWIVQECTDNAERGQLTEVNSQGGGEHVSSRTTTLGATDNGAHQFLGEGRMAPRCSTLAVS